MLPVKKQALKATCQTQAGCMLTKFSKTMVGQKDEDQEASAWKSESIMNVVVEKQLLRHWTRYKRNDRVGVKTRAIFSKVSEINTTKESFHAEIFFEAKWREPLLDGKTEISRKSINWNDYWNPELNLDNLLGEVKQISWQSITFGPNGEATMLERRKIIGRFDQSMDLKHFPFDVQDLSFTVVSERPCSEIVFVIDPKEMSLVSQNSFVQNQEWKVYNYVDTQKDEVLKIYENSGRIRHPMMSYVCRARRRHQFYLYNFILILFFINSMTFTTFSISVDKPENRLQLTFILLLTTVSFRTNINNTLPKIPYLTRMDHIILTSFAIQCTICLWHSIVSSLKKYRVLDQRPLGKNDSTQSELSYFGNSSALPLERSGSGARTTEDLTALDRYALLIFGFVYVSLHVLFAVLVHRQISNKEKEFKEKEKLFKECFDN